MTWKFFISLKLVRIVEVTMMRTDLVESGPVKLTKDDQKEESEDGTIQSVSSVLLGKFYI